MDFIPILYSSKSFCIAQLITSISNKEKIEEAKLTIDFFYLYTLDIFNNKDGTQHCELHQ